MAVKLRGHLSLHGWPLDGTRRHTIGDKTAVMAIMPNGYKLLAQPCPDHDNCYAFFALLDPYDALVEPFPNALREHHLDHATACGHVKAIAAQG